MLDNWNSVSEDIKEIKQDVKELLVQDAVQNELLRTHEARSLALQEQAKILREQHTLTDKKVDIVWFVLQMIGMLLAGILIRFIPMLIKH